MPEHLTISPEIQGHTLQNIYSAKLMDIVITYVNGNDPAWRSSYAEATGNARILSKRFRDWETLPYLFRGIEKHMPFIRNVYLVLSGPGQVPGWMSDEVKIVYHKDIIPSECLPVFNSTAIEMFLHKIEGLDEEFVYFNDDIFPVMDVSPEDLFVDNKAVMHYSRHILALNLYKKHIRNSDRLARKIAGKKHGLSFIRPQHLCTPMLRSLSEEIMSKAREQIMDSITPLRAPHNFCQHLYTDYQYFTGNNVNKRISGKHFSMAVKTADDVRRFLEKPDRTFVCVNDVDMSDARFEKEKSILLDAFEAHFPQKSKYEK